MRNLFIAILIIVSATIAIGQENELFGLRIGDTKKQIVATLATQGIKLIGGTPKENIGNMIYGGPNSKLDSFHAGCFIRPMNIGGNNVNLIRLYFKNKLLVKVDVEIDGLLSDAAIANLDLQLTNNQYRKDTLDGKSVTVGFAEYKRITNTSTIMLTVDASGNYDDGILRGYRGRIISIYYTDHKLLSITKTSTIKMSAGGF